MNFRTLTLLIAASFVPFSAHAYEAEDLVGVWCFYEQEAVGNKIRERVTITLREDGSYYWSDTLWKQEGSWSVEDNSLVMSSIGSHKLVSVTKNNVEMVRLSTMRMRNGPCR